MSKSFSNKKIQIKKLSLKSPILSEILFRIDGGNILSNEYKVQKFTNLLKEEVHECLFNKSKPGKK